MSNTPTLPPGAAAQRKPTPLPALAGESDARVQAALAANARAEASLSSLFRAIQQLGNGVGGAREANESLTVELEGLRDLLGAAKDQQQILERKIAQLELVLDRTRREHAQERVFLIDQQDLFLVKLLDEQELELKQRDGDLDTLRGRLTELERRGPLSLPPPLAPLPGLSTPALTRSELDPPQSVVSEQDRAERAELERTVQKLADDRERARETVARLQAQRDEAQNAVVRIGKELDDALQEIHRLKSELGGPRIPMSTRPPPSESRPNSRLPREHAKLPGLEHLENALLAHATASAGGPANPPSTSSPIAGSPSDSAKAQPIRSILGPPGSNTHASAVPSRLLPPLAPLSPPALRNSPPPEELRRALTASESLRPSPDSRSPLKQKPDASTRPLVGYSLGTDSVEPEHLEGAPLLSNPPPGSVKR